MDKPKEVEFSVVGGCQINPKHAPIIGAELHRLTEEAGGKLTPEQVEEAARSESSPLHPYFTWDDAEAAYLYRLDEARHLIRSVRVTYVKQEKSEPVVVRAFYNVEQPKPEKPLERQNIYVPVGVAMENPDYRRQILGQALMEAKHWKRKYNDLTELAVVFDAIEKAEQTLL